jgi:murein DD-endopeptidase MepM/ murein hydrolase activator NlpD
MSSKKVVSRMRHRSRRWINGIACLSLTVAAATWVAHPTSGIAAESVGSATALKSLHITRGDTLFHMLVGAGVERIDADEVGKAVQRILNPRRMMIGQEIKLLFGSDGELLVVSIETGEDRFVEATLRSDGSYGARRTNLALEPKIAKSDTVFGGTPQELTVGRGDTIGAILARHGITAGVVDAAVDALRTRYDPRRLMPGQAISVVASRDDRGRPVLNGFAVHLDGDDVVAVIRAEGGGFIGRRTSWSTLREAPAPEPTVAEATPAEAPKPELSTDAQPISPPVAAMEPPAMPGPDANKHAAEAQAETVTPNPPATSQAADAPSTHRQFALLHEGSTLMELLIEADVRRPEADAAIRSIRRVFDPRQLMPGVSVRITKGVVRGSALRLVGLDIVFPEGRHIQVTREGKGRFVSAIQTDSESADELSDFEIATAAPKEIDGIVLPIAKPVASIITPVPMPVQRVKDEPRPATVAVAAAAPQEPANTPEIENVPAEPATALPPLAKRVKVRAGDTLMAILRRHGIDRAEADRAIRATREIFNPRRLSIGQEIALITGIDQTGANSLEAFAIRLTDDRFVQVTRSADGPFEANRVAALDLRVDRERMVASADQAAQTPRVDRADKAGHGQVMNGALVAGSAPIEPAEETNGHSNGVALASGMALAISAVESDDDDHVSGLIRKAVVIDKGDTLFTTLTRAGSADEDAEAAIAAFRKVHNPRRLQIGQTLSLAFEPEQGAGGDLQLAELALDVAPDLDVVVTRSDDGAYLSRAIDRPLERVLRKTTGHIQTNLYDAAFEAGVPIQVLMEMLHVFSYDVDFQREIQPGDGFELLYEVAYDQDGNFVEHGPVLYSALRVGERDFALYRYEPDDGPADYLDSNGESARKALMRTPINGARLSSGYGMRKHPILGYSKKHHGLDFAAARGTPILAAGDGVIEVAGRNGAYGKYIRIRHNGTYSTAYAHMNGYAKGMKKGKRVRQGQIIGYVGSTGRSTGPHLHYEVLKDRTQINPMNLKLPTGLKLQGLELAAFKGQMQKISVLLNEVPVVTQVASQ